VTGSNGVIQSLQQLPTSSRIRIPKRELLTTSKHQLPWCRGIYQVLWYCYGVRAKLFTAEIQRQRPSTKTFSHQYPIDLAFLMLATATCTLIRHAIKMMNSGLEWSEKMILNIVVFRNKDWLLLAPTEVFQPVRSGSKGSRDGGSPARFSGSAP